jgi:hypothetical protein
VTVSYEAFVYLWFDSKNRKFYLGCHKGHENDWYTHSSNVMESFSKSTIPSHMRRRILARGSHEEMLQLENDLIDIRRKRCWDKYHNVRLGLPPPPRYGKDNHFYVHGKSRSGAREYREFQRETNPNFLEQGRERSRRYRANNPEKVAESRRKYRAKKKAEKAILAGQLSFSTETST